MRAKDTVISNEDSLDLDIPCETCDSALDWDIPTRKCLECITLQHREAQAKVSFMAGIKEIADNLSWKNTCYQTVGGSPIIQIQISEAEWHARLEECGL